VLQSAFVFVLAEVPIHNLVVAALSLSCGRSRPPKARRRNIPLTISDSADNFQKKRSNASQEQP
jgi:hypothetical protein